MTTLQIEPQSLKQSRNFLDTITATFDRFDLIVETFDKAAADPVYKIVEDRLPMTGQGGDKPLKTIKAPELDFFKPTGEPMFALWPGLGLIKN